MNLIVLIYYINLKNLIYKKYLIIQKKHKDNLLYAFFIFNQ